MIVVDASAVGTFLIPDEAGPFADYAQALCTSEALYAPPHWSVEVASLIRKAERFGRLSAEQADHAARRADTLAAFVTIEPIVIVSEIVAGSRASGLTIYDTPYLLLAQRLGMALLSDDRRLRDVAVERGVRVLLP